jgi:hypothetical protein
MKKTLLALLLTAATMPLLQAQAVQKVLVEEYTGAWCGYCPDGALILEDVLNANPNAIAASVHNSDAMYNSIGGTMQSFYNPAYPQATINRNSAPISRGAWASAVNTALQKSPVVAVSIDSAGFDIGTRTLKVKIKATFLRDTTGQMRFNMYLTEDDVVGSGSGYDQVNYYNSTSGHPLQGLGNPILNYQHNHVFRDAAGGAWGTNGVIPSTVTAGEDFWHTYTKVIPVGWDINNMHIIGMVNHHGTTMRPTLNAEEVPFSFATSIFGGSAATGLEMEIYPNPLQTRSTIGFNLTESGHVMLEVYSVTGQKVRVLANDVTNSGMHTMYWDGMDQSGSPVADGLYIVRLSTEAGGSISKRIMVHR